MLDAQPTATTGESDRRAPIIVDVALTLGAMVVMFPFVWQVLTSFKTYDVSVLEPPKILPDPWTLANYIEVFNSVPFGNMFVNSVILTAGRTLGQIALCSLAGYAFARIEFPGRKAIFIVFLSLLMLPSQLYIIPQYEIMQSLGWLNSMQALIVPGLFSAFGTFLMRQFFLSLPSDIEEAARIDGANTLQIFWYVVLPLAKPGVVALSIFTILWSWNEFLWPLIVNTDPKKMPVPVGLASLIGEHLTDYPVLMAGAVLAMLPMIALFIMMQRQFIEGIAFTGTKG